MKYFMFTVLLLCFNSSQQAFSAMTPTPLRSVWHDTTVQLFVQPSAPTIKKKVGFWGKVKATLFSFMAEKAAPKQSGDKKRVMNIVSLSLLLTGLAVPLLGGPIAFLLLIPASLVTGIVALSMKDGKNAEVRAMDGRKKRRSNAAAITAIVVASGLLLLFGGLALFWNPHH